MSYQKFKIPLKVEKELQNADYVIHCGDFSSDDVYYTFTEYGAKFIAVAGNNDFNMLTRLPDKRLFEINNLTFGVAHGWGGYNELPHKILKQVFYNDNIHILFYGHTHIPLVKKIGNVLTVNPGSLQHNRDGSGMSFAIMNIVDDTIKDIEIKYI